MMQASVSLVHKAEDKMNHFIQSFVVYLQAKHVISHRS